MGKEKELLNELVLSPVNLLHLELLSDSAGIRQHAIHGIPLLESGYTIDDNARALIAMLQYGELFQEEIARPSCIKYLSFMNHMQTESGMFRNTLSFDRQIVTEGESLDCLGRAVWACGKTVNSWLNENNKIIAEKMFGKTLPLLEQLWETRPIAFSILGLNEMAKAGHENAVGLIDLLGERMVGMFEENSDEGWQWFEDSLTYDNARLPQAMFSAFQATGKKSFLEVAEKSFEFLAKTCFEGEMFVPVGQDGWYPKFGEKALFDQQPIEAGSMAQAGVEAFLSTSNDEYKKIALSSFNWFFGGNKLGAAVYDKKTGACFDGITSKEVNLNQGAESLVEFLIARFSIEKMRRQKI